MEPERPIEKLLRAVAKKRREEGSEPFELHPLARQELLREVSRRSAPKKGGLFLRFLSGLHPRFALALCGLALAVIGAALLMPLLREKRNVSTLAAAQNSFATPTLNNNLSPSPATTAPANAPVLAEKSAKNSTVVLAGTRNVQTIALKPAPPNEANRKLAFAPVESPKPITGVEDDVTLDNSSQFRAPVPAAAAPAATFEAARPYQPAAEASAAGNAATTTVGGSIVPQLATNAVMPSLTLAASEPPAAKDSEEKELPAFSASHAAMFDGTVSDRTEARLPISQRFYRVTVTPAARQRGFGGGGAGAAVPLLSSFQVEQNGKQLRVVDTDGSVYTGTWRVAPTANAPPAAAPAGVQKGPVTPNAVRQAQPVRNSAGSYFFRVAGTNRNLKQEIVFSGNFVPLTNAPTADTFKIPGAANAFGVQQNPPGSSMLLNSQISGKVVIGGKREIKLDAIPAP